MADKDYHISHFYGGISDSEKSMNGPMAPEFRFGAAKNLNVLNDPGQATLQPAAVKESGSTITALPKWIVPGDPWDTNTYIYDASGNIYKRTSGAVYSSLRAVASSVGQGMDVYNDYLYYTQNTQIGRYGPLSSAPGFTDNWQTSLNDSSGLGFAPVKAFPQGLAVGHGNKVALWDGTVWTVDKLVLPPEVKIRAFAQMDEYLVIGTTTNNTFQSSHTGYLFFWDGISSQFNYYTKVDGGVGALLNNKNRLMTAAGQAGYIYLDSQPMKKLTRIPKLKGSKYVEIYPGAVTNYQELACFGVAANTDSTDVVEGVYQWGARADQYQEGLNMSNTISTGNITSIKIGALCGSGNNLLIGWQDGSNYGVDLVSRTANPYATGSLETTIIDDGRPDQEKLPRTLVATHFPLAAGESITLGQKVNRASSYTMDSANTTVGSVETTLPLTGVTRFQEAQAIVQLATSGSTSPTLTSIRYDYDDLSEERPY